MSFTTRSALTVRTAAVAVGAALAFGVSAGLPAVAGAKTVRGSTTDPTGDGPAPGRDIISSSVRYSSNGTLLFIVTTAGPIDGAGADAAVGASLGTTCNKLVVLGGGAFSAPDPVAFFRVKGQKKIGKPKEGQGKVTGNVYTLKVKDPVFKGLKPGCFAVALVDPNSQEGQLPTPFDQTGEIKF